MRLRRFFLLLIIHIVFPSNYLLSQMSYPEWFLNPGRYPELVTGFSLHGHSTKEDAAIMYCLYKKCIIEGYLETIEIKTRTFLKNSAYYYVYEKDCQEEMKGKLYHISGYCNDVITESIVSAFSTEKVLYLDTTRIDPTKYPLPGWTEMTSWKQDGYHYGVGIFTSRGNDNDAWKTSEEQAIFNILTSNAIEIYTLERFIDTNDDSNYLDYKRIYIDFKLKDIETLKRWPDQGNGYFYTLVRIKEENIVSYK